VLLEDEKIKTIVEKIVISDMATSGLYLFSNVDKFLEFYTSDNIYISDLYQKMIDSNSKIAINEIHNENDTVVLGTPSEYLTAAYILDL
jgi:hypothetical protein